MKFILKSCLIFIAFNMSAQNINGIYNYIHKDSKSKPFQIEISKDTIYIVKSEINVGDNGKIIRKGKFYYLVSCCLIKQDSINNITITGLPVKITRHKIIVYGYKPKAKKLTKAFELEKYR